MVANCQWPYKSCSWSKKMKDDANHTLKDEAKATVVWAACCEDSDECASSNGSNLHWSVSLLISDEKVHFSQNEMPLLLSDQLFDAHLFIDHHGHGRE